MESLNKMEKSERCYVRLEPEYLDLWKKAAKLEGQSLSDFVREKINLFINLKYSELMEENFGLPPIVDGVDEQDI